MNPEPVDVIAVIDFGGQYAHLIANRIRRLGVFTKIYSSESSVKELNDVKGIVFSGGPMSVYAKDAPKFNKDILSIGVPILGICYGHQLIAHSLGGTVAKGEIKEYGIAELQVKDSLSPLLKDIPNSSRAWMSHGDQISELPSGFKQIAQTNDCVYAAVENFEKKIYGIQFHPEVTHSECGTKLLSNFIDICECERLWDVKSYLPQISEKILEHTGDKKVFLLVSGGVDSTVAFVLMNKVLGADRVLGLHIDNGMMRKGESKQIFDFLHKEGMGNLLVSEAADDFISELKDVSEPEAKRKIIGDTFLWVKDREMSRLSLDAQEWMVAQGTIYPDTIESGGTKNADLIKTHHNRVPAVLDLQEKGLLLEPLADLYKDEVRILGEELGIPQKLIWRHPFPGPGLGVRLLCGNKDKKFKKLSDFPELKDDLSAMNLAGELLPVQSVGVQGDSRTYAQPLLLNADLSWEELESISTKLTNKFHCINRVVLQIGRIEPKMQIEQVEQQCDKTNLDLLRTFDDICTKFLEKNNLYEKVWQMPVILLPLRIAQKPCVVMRPVNSSEAMTANFAKLPKNLLKTLYEDLRVAGAGALFYDITHKPPATIEWE